MQTALRRKRETGNEKDPSAAFGMTIRGKAYLTFFFTPLRKPTSGAPRHLLPKEGGRMVKAIYPLPVEGGCPKGRGLASFFAAKPPSLSLPPWGRGTASAVDRVLSLMAHLRRSPSSLSYRQYPIRLAPLATFPTRGRLCFGNTAIPIQPPPLRGTSFQRKEGECRLPYNKAFSPHRHFERKREIFFVCGGSGKVRTADNGKHRTPSE